ncbi:MAG: type II toxin-antitoxin system RelE/ParE family toxin [Cyanobacteria bacterium P01_G01_bin.54]
MGTYAFTDEAILDIEEICEDLSQYSQDNAIRFFETVREKCRQVAQFPNMGKNYSEIAPNLRGFVVKNYIVFYFPHSNGINVTRVINGYRDLEALSIGSTDIS